MAPIPTFADFYFRDDASRVTKVRYRLLEAAEDDGSNMADVFTAADALETELNVLTNDHIDYYQLVLQNGGGGAAADDNSNNQVVAFVRTVITSTGDTSSFEVPSWDSDAYDKDRDNFLDAAFNTAAADVAALTVDPETGLAWTVMKGISRAREGRKRQAR